MSDGRLSRIASELPAILRPHLLALGAASGVLAIAAWWLAWPRGEGANPSPLFFVPHLLLAWLAWRGRPFATAAATLLLAVGLLGAQALGLGPHGSASSGFSAALVVGDVASWVAVALVVFALARSRAEAENRWRLVLGASSIGVDMWDLSRGRGRAPARWIRRGGNVESEAKRHLDALLERIHPDDRERVRHAVDALHGPCAPGATGTSRVECRMVAPGGGWGRFELCTVVTERFADGSARRIVQTRRDINAVQAARDGEMLAQSVFRHLHEGLLITDAQHRVVEANPRFCDITGYTREELLGTLPPPLRGPQEPALASQLEAMRRGLDARGTWHGELSHRRRDGGARVMQLTVTAVRDADGRVLNHVVAAADLTHARAQRAQLERQAHFDELTRLPNRVRLAQMLETAMATTRREGSLLTVCYLDLDHFKEVNDRYGHPTGDRLLVEVANRMRRSLRSWAGGDDVVARIGGDEFVLLLRTATLEESRHAVERVLSQLGQPHGLGDGPVFVTASIGSTVFPLDGADAETLLRHADYAMYGAKQAGRNGYLYFDAEHDRRAEARFVALGRVQEALDANEFRLYFQPKVDMRHSKVLGVEALLRWKHPEQGVISPAQFLPLIENTGLSISVGNWVLQQGIEQLARWQQSGLDLSVSINVSARHLQEPLFAQHLAGLLSRHEAPVAHRLIIEVLETAALADVDYTCDLMQQCRLLGVRFALDDFGTGYSTFTYLKRLPIDLLKIDRSFVINMLGDRQDLAIVEGVIGLSQTFGCTVVAEGVETAAQAQRLIEIGCDVGQGNGIAPAMPAEAVPGWVREFRGMVAPRGQVVLA